MSDGVQRIVSLLGTARSSKQVAAILVPRVFAISLADEIYPEESQREATGHPTIDRVNQDRYERWRAQRDEYNKLIEGGGYVGSIFGIPMIVADDVVLCALSREEAMDCASRLGIDTGEFLDRKG